MIPLSINSSGLMNPVSISPKGQGSALYYKEPSSPFTTLLTFVSFLYIKDTSFQYNHESDQIGPLLSALLDDTCRYHYPCLDHVKRLKALSSFFFQTILILEYYRIFGIKI